MTGLALTEDENRRAKMRALYPRTHGPNGPDRYRAIAEWLRLHAEESAVPDEQLLTAAAQDAIADDMLCRPHHYRLRPLHFTDYEWSKRP